MARSSVIVISVSAGGVTALRSLAAALPKTLSAPDLVVLHTGAHQSELPVHLKMTAIQDLRSEAARRLSANPV